MVDMSPGAHEELAQKCEQLSLSQPPCLDKTFARIAARSGKLITVNPLSDRHAVLLGGAGLVEDLRYI